MSRSAGRDPAEFPKAQHYFVSALEKPTSRNTSCHLLRESTALRRLLCHLFLLMALIVPSRSLLAVTLAWDASPSSGVSGYRIYYGKTSGIYTGLMDVGNVTTASVPGLSAGATYYFAIVAYNAAVVLSDFSNGINYTVPGGTPSVNGSGSGVTGGPSSNPPLGSGYVTGQNLGTLHNDFSGYAGMKIVVGSTPISVSALGRFAGPGNWASHLVKIVDASDGTDVLGGSVSISFSGSIAGQFVYASLSTPVVLAAGAAYYIVSKESSGGDGWYYNDTTITATTAATETSAAWGYGPGQWYLNGGAGQSFGPLDFRYSTASPKSNRYITSSALGSLRNGFSGYAGMQIFVGATPISVTGLGRMAAPGNGGTHLLKLVDGSDGTDVPGGSVTVSMSGSIAGQFQYANLSAPVVLLPGSAYYVLSQETSRGDAWYYDDTLVQTMPVATELSGAWGYGSGQWYLNGGAGQTFGPLDIKYTTTTLAKSQPYLLSQTLGTAHNDFSGFAGMRFVVGSRPLNVTALGRIVAGGNSGTHTVKLVNAANGADVPGGAVSVSTGSGTAGQFQYTSLAVPVVLPAGQTYYLVSQETSGGDTWYYDDTIVTTSAVATETSGIWGYGQGQWYLNGYGGQSYGPVDFKYSAAPPPEPQRYLTGETLGTAHNDFSGFAGMQIVVGANALTVTALGRMVAGGNSGTHLVKLVNASDGTDVPGGSVSVSMSGGTVGQFQYANLSNPVVLTAGKTYLVMSQETSGGDTWYYNDTVVYTTSVARQTAGAWGYGNGQWYLNGTAGYSYGPVDFKCIPNGG
jgi:hypothetical protein